MSPPMADPDEVAEWAASQPTANILCRLNKHRWADFGTTIPQPGGVLLEVSECERKCGNTRTVPYVERRRQRRVERGRAKIAYDADYTLPRGMGRIGAAANEALQWERFSRRHLAPTPTAQEQE